MLVKDLMTRKLHTVGEDDDIKTACKSLTKYRLSGIPVVSRSGRLTGFVSERDIIAAVPKKNFCNMKVRNIMSRKVRTIPQDDPVTHASKIFSEEKYRLLPVLKGAKLVGIISRNDIVKQMMKHYY